MRWRHESLRAVLFGYGIGHLVTAAMFLVWPEYFLVGEGSPPWPFSILQFGVWPPVHQGFMNVVAVYDIAVAFGLLLAARDPVRHDGLISFAIVLWVLHGGVHAYHIVWGSSPVGYWWTVGELWIGAAALLLLFPKRAPST